MESLKIGIPTVPERLAMAQRLTGDIEYIFNTVLGGRIEYEIKIFLDAQKTGVWWNEARILQHFLGSDILIVQDDVKFDYDAFGRHFMDVISHLDNFGLISLFTPFRNYDNLVKEGYNSVVSYDFMCACTFLVNRNFIPLVLEIDNDVKKNLVGEHDEVRFRLAAQKYSIPLCTLIGSFSQHRTDVKSAMGNPHSIAGKTRETKYFAKDMDSYKVLKHKVPSYAKPDLKKYLRDQDKS